MLALRESPASYSGGPRLLDRVRAAIRARHYSRRTDVLAHLDGAPQLVAMLLYGCGLRLLECLQLRVKDLDFTANQITIRSGKGARDRVTTLPAATKSSLLEQIARVRRQHADDLERRAGLGMVTRRARAKVSPGCARDRMAVGLSGYPVLRRRAHRTAPATSPA